MNKGLTVWMRNVIESLRYISKTYEIQPQRFAVLRMNSASIKGLHASLNMVH